MARHCRVEKKKTKKKTLWRSSSKLKWTLQHKGGVRSTAFSEVISSCYWIIMLRNNFMLFFGLFSYIFIYKCRYHIYENRKMCGLHPDLNLPSNTCYLDLKLFFSVTPKKRNVTNVCVKIMINYCRLLPDLHDSCFFGTWSEECRFWTLTKMDSIPWFGIDFLSDLGSLAFKSASISSTVKWEIRTTS